MKKITENFEEILKIFDKICRNFEKNCQEIFRKFGVNFDEILRQLTKKKMSLIWENSGQNHLRKF